ncbi:MAG: helix-turn-helix transcriptional regulator [Leptospirales bacterium]|nr:helix-turn-helix transcriptional regulator [Leptospirales bacterium]
MTEKQFIRAVGREIRKIRERKDLSQEATSGLEMSNRNYQRLEAGDANARLTTLLKIAQALDVHPKEFFNFELGKPEKVVKRKV